MSKRVSVVFPTLGKPELLSEVVDSILNQDYEDVELIIVVNGPHAQIMDILSEYGERIRVIQNAENVGFTRGMNQAAAAATGHYIYLTANDIVLAPDYLRTLVETAERTEGWGILGGIWYDHDQRDRVYLAGGSLDFTPTLRIQIHEDPPRSSEPYDVDWMAGAAIFTSTEAWRALNGLRDDFFFHCEDLDLCIRVRRAGGYIRLVPGARLYHHDHPRGISSSHKVEYYKLRNNAALNALYGPAWSLPWSVLKNVLFTVPRIAYFLRSPGFYLGTMGGIIKATPGWLSERFLKRPKPPVIRAISHDLSTQPR